MPDAEGIVQRDIESGGGDVAAGDIDKSLHLHFRSSGENGSYLTQLYHQLSDEIRKQKKIEDTCELLSDFVATTENEVIGLETKLAQGGMASQTTYAKKCKEAYVKNLTKFSMYETAQVIHAFLLGKVESGYATSVLPNLDIIPPGQKFELMRKAVLDNIEATLGKNPLRIHPAEIDGMAFFLTGKCRLKWTNEAQ